MTIGIYKLNFKGTDKVYIGKSDNISRRYREHKSSLNTGKCNKYLLQAFLLYGEPTIEIIHECCLADLDSLEEYYIKLYNATNFGYNILTSANIGLRGEEHGKAKFPNLDIEKVFDLLIDYPEKTFKDISAITGVTIEVISSISKGSHHRWLEDKFPERYIKLKQLTCNRYKSGELNGNSVYTNEQILKVFELLVLCKYSKYEDIEVETSVDIKTITSISNLHNHTWLKILHPDKYSTLEKLKYSRDNYYETKIDSMKNHSIISPEGVTYTDISNITKFAKEHGLDPSHLCKMFKGKAKTCKGWKLA